MTDRTILGVTVHTDGTLARFEAPAKDLLKHLYAAIGCTMVEVVWTPDEDRTIWMDEEGLYAAEVIPNKRMMAIANEMGQEYPQLVGTAVITGGMDDEGYSLGLSTAEVERYLSGLYLGAPVVDAGGYEYTYGGPQTARDSAMVSVEFNMRHGSQPVIRCDESDVAPAGVLVPSLKDDRMVVENLKDQRPGPWVAGPWYLRIRDGVVPNKHWFKTKRDATAYGALHLAIGDWHENHAELVGHSA